MGMTHMRSGPGLSRRSVLKAGGALAAASAIAGIPTGQAVAAGQVNQIFLDSLVRTGDGGRFLRVIATARQGDSQSGNVGTGEANTARLGRVGWGELKVDVIKGPNTEPDWMQNKFTVDSATTAGDVITLEGRVYRARNPQNADKPVKIIITRAASQIAAVELLFDSERYTGFGPLFESSP
jgi:hypothetical protein